MFWVRNGVCARRIYIYIYPSLLLSPHTLTNVERHMLHRFLKSDTKFLFLLSLSLSFLILMIPLSSEDCIHLRHSDAFNKKKHGDVVAIIENASKEEKTRNARRKLQQQSESKTEE